MKVNFLYKSVFKLLSLLSLLVIFNTYGSEHISFGTVSHGEKRIDLRVKDFKIHSSLPFKLYSKIRLKKNSIQWIRTEDVLLIPRARLIIDIKAQAEDFNLRYAGHSILPQQKKEMTHIELFVSLFSKEPIEVIRDGKKIGEIKVEAKSVRTGRNSHLIDFSCSKYNIETKGLENQFLSIGCRSHRIGKMGNEMPMVEILWATPNYRLLDKSKPPYISIFTNSNPLKVKVQNRNEKKVFKIKADIPKRLHRLNIAYGLGPYVFETTFQDEKKDKKEVVIDQPIAPALMLYFNYKLDKKNSIRGFDAVVFQESTFNNLGIYYASDLASTLDGKLTFTSLLGVQHLHFKFNNDSPTISEPIFPQGLEINYNHAFNIPNYLIGGGAFISPSESYDYQNIWIRWGKGIFWELNYIYWAKDEFSAKTWGLSAGFFFGGFL